MANENNSIFRHSNNNRLSTPEELNSYVKICKPGTVVILIAILLLVIGLIIWAALTSSGDGSFLKFLFN